jgi:hypothetical protein
MTENLLSREASPYLLQHKGNPVHWRPWGTAALDEAQRTNKPILLSIGYAACHWCHVMAHESFEDPEIAALMNRLFVNIKVDREERPDIDQIYMAALHELGEQGGWPLTMFLTSRGDPIWGGTYFPPTARYGRPGFPEVLNEIARLFRQEPDKIETNRAFLHQRLTRPPDTASLTLDNNLLDSASARLLALMDAHAGGIRGAPKFPQAGLLEFLWRAGQRTGDAAYRDAVMLTLRTIAGGGIYDHVGGGFARYSVDSRWLVPHFEKMLYDNAQLIDLYAHAHLATRDPVFRLRIEETVAWLEREMMVEDGVFAASLDADSEGHEGRFYVWTYDEVLDVLGDDEGPFFAAAYDITPDGNWDGVSIPNRLSSPQLRDQQTEERLARSRSMLLARRATRVRPTRDDKVLADWNGLLAAALATAGTLLARPEWIDISTRTYRRLLSLMSRDGRLAHSYRDTKRVFPGLATDYAALIKAALALHAATLQPEYLADAERLAASLRAHHWDPDHPGYFLSANDADAIFVRPRSNVDEATPSANAVMGINLMRLWRLTGKDHYRRDLDDLLSASAGSIGANLFAATGTLNALDTRLNAVDVVAVRPTGGNLAPVLAEIHRHWTYNLILSVHEETARLPEMHPAAGKTAIDGKTTVYVCRGESCSLPVTEPDALAALF